MSDPSDDRELRLADLENILADMSDGAHIGVYNTQTHKEQALVYSHTYFAYPQSRSIDPGMDIPTKIRQIMKKTGDNQGEVAVRFKTNQPNVSRWLKGSEPEGHHRDTINQVYDEVFGAAADQTSVIKVMGYVGAGAEIMPDYEQVPPEGLEEVEVNFPLPDGIIAFRVRGDSMLPQFRDGTIIFVWAEQKRPIDAFYGAEAVVRTSSGHRYIKTIMRGSSGGNVVNLVSWNAAPIENQRLEWIGEIYLTMPPQVFSAPFPRFSRAAG